jgi:hypothetical protein
LDVLIAAFDEAELDFSARLDHVELLTVGDV